MKQLYLTLCFVFSCFAMFTQNYSTATILRNNYYAVTDVSTPGKLSFETLSFDSTTFSGTELYSYPLCSFANEMDENSCYFTNDTGWTGFKMIRRLNGEEVYFTLGGDSIILYTAAQQSQSWHLFELGGGDYIEASITSIIQQNTAVGIDSCKVITLQAKNNSGTPIANTFNNKTVVLGKDNGFIRCYRWRDFPTDTTSLNIAGTNSPASGVQNLTARSVFDFSVGDVFEYKYEWNGMANGSSVTYTRKEVISKYVSSNNDTLIYSYDRKIYSKSYTYTPAFDSTITTTFDTLSETIVVPDCRILNGYAVQFNIDTAGNFGNGVTAGTMEEQFVNASQYNGRMQKVGYPNYNLNNYPCVQDIGGGVCVWHYHYFADGIGLTEKKDETGGVNPASCGHTYLVYFSKGTENWGTPIDWGTLLGVNFTDKDVLVDVFPNPTHDEVNFLFPRQFNGEIKIVSAEGKTVSHKNISCTQHKSSVSQLEAGIYFYRLTDENGKISCGKFSVMR